MFNVGDKVDMYATSPRYGAKYLFEGFVQEVYGNKVRVAWMKDWPAPGQTNRGWWYWRKSGKKVGFPIGRFILPTNGSRTSRWRSIDD